MTGTNYTNLSPRLRALVAIAVLFDGQEAAAFLENDLDEGSVLMEAATELASLSLDLRMSYVGTLLRVALSELGNQGGGK